MRPESASAMSRRVYSFYRAVTATYIISTLVVMAFYHSARWNSGGSDSQQPPITKKRFHLTADHISLKRMVYFFFSFLTFDVRLSCTISPCSERLSIRSTAQGAALEALLGCDSDCRVYG